MDKVSVIIPVYNAEKYILETVKSIISQCYKVLEIILVNDGSTDNSIDIARNVLKQEDIPFTIVSKQNGGLSSARNAGLKAATGQYVCFIDADDIINESHITNLIQLMKENNLSVCFSDFECTLIKNREGATCKTYSSKLLSKKEIEDSFCRRSIKIHCCSLLIDKDFLKDNSIFFNENLRYGEDVDFIWRLLSKINSIGHCQCNTYKYLIHENSIMSQQSLTKAIVFRDEFLLTINKLIEEQPGKASFYKLIYNRTMFGLLHSFSKQSNLRDFKKLSQTIDAVLDINTLMYFPDNKIRIFSVMYHINPAFFWTIIKIIRR